MLDRMSNRARGPRAASPRPLARIRALALPALITLGVGACATAAPESPDRPRLRVLMTNDFHGRLRPERPGWADGAEVGGAAVLAGYFAAERTAFDGPTVLLDGGDIMQGTPISNLTDGRSTIEYYNLVGYDAAAIGNHEFDWTVAVLRERIEQAEFAWLSANVFVAGTDTAPSWAQATTTIDAGDVTIGILGLSTESTPWTTMPSKVRGLEFRSGAQAMDRWVPELRRNGVDFVIVVAHAGAVCAGPTSNDGNRAGTPVRTPRRGERVETPVEMRDCRGEIIDWARATTHKPDLIVGGHAHRVVRTRENGIPIIQAGSYGTRYGMVDLERVRDDSVAAWIRGTPIAWPEQLQPDSAVAELVARRFREVRPAVERVIARLAEPLRRGPEEHALGRLLADAQRAATDAQVAIMNNGGIRTDVAEGPVTWGELFEVQPFGNLLVKLQLTGAQLREAIEHVVRGRAPSAHVSGIVVDYDPDAEPGERVHQLRLTNGDVVNDTGVYTVTVNGFMAEGGDGFEVLTRATRRDNTEIVDLDALVGYLQGLPQPVEPPSDQRLRSARKPSSESVETMSGQALAPASARLLALPGWRQESSIRR